MPILPLAAEERLHRLLSESLAVWIGLIFAIVLLAWIISRVRAWYRDDDDPAGSTQQMLSEIREMYVEGELSEEEFRSIKGRLNSRTERAATDTKE
jgi:uncharacterized membrane protein